jgi:SAM-dependent methyltransferase
MASGTPKSRPRNALAETLSIGKTFLRVMAGYGALIVAIAAVTFPRHSDPVVTRSVPKRAQSYYADVYAKPGVAPEEIDLNDGAYVKIGQEAISNLEIVPRVREFVRQYRLENARVLDVGAGTGYLQDVVENYVGLDISPSAARYYHKPFVAASATEMPFGDGEFDAAWSIWVLEHVPTPEQALVEIRRVTRDGGLLYLLPAWNCTPWAAEGYPVRPYSDFGVRGKMIKAAIPVLEFPMLKVATTYTARLGMMARARLASGPSKLHYRRITPNYKHYWMPDSDAINSIDRYETSLWFTSRGDECLNCAAGIFGAEELVIRVHKSAKPR